MNHMKSLAIALVILGIAGLVYGGLGFGRNRTTMEMGSMSASVTESGPAPVVAVVGGIALLGGILLLVYEKRRAS
jgi:uncharacterized membrane protein YidH (DUF202 family)